MFLYGVLFEVCGSSEWGQKIGLCWLAGFMSLSNNIGKAWWL